VLPFMFIFNTQLLMIGIDHWWELMLTIVSAVVAILLFAAATQGYFLVRSRIWETLVLLLASFTLFRPGYWMDQLFPPLKLAEASSVTEIAEGMPEGGGIRLLMEGETLEGNHVSTTVELPLGAKASGSERLAFAGLELREQDGRILVDNVIWNSPAQLAKIDFDWEIKAIELPLQQPDKYWMYLPALLLLGGIVFLQKRRRKAHQAQGA